MPPGPEAVHWLRLVALNFGRQASGLMESDDVGFTGARTTGGKQFMSRNFELLQKIGREQSLYATTAEEPMQEMEPPPVVVPSAHALEIAGAELEEITKGSATSYSCCLETMRRGCVFRRHGARKWLQLGVCAGGGSVGRSGLWHGFAWWMRTCEVRD